MQGHLYRLVQTHNTATISIDMQRGALATTSDRLVGIHDAQDSVLCVPGKWLPGGPATEPSSTLFSSIPLNPWGQRPSLTTYNVSSMSLLLINMAAACIISLKIWSPDSIIFYYAEVSQVFYILLAY